MVDVQEQKEARPGDELVLLAVQQLNGHARPRKEIIVAILLLEEAIDYSPSNPYLKIEAMLTYSDLHAGSRALELFQELHVKQIQHESCIYLVIPLLRANGLYREVVEICKMILHLQRSNLRDAGEYTGISMEHGTLSKAEEFMTFQRTRLNRSLSALEARGLILDCAPFYVTDAKSTLLGEHHGIVGEENDFDRACKMVTETHDPLAAFSVLRLPCEMDLLDNRDHTVLDHQMLDPRPADSHQDIVDYSLHRSFRHNLLIRTTLTVEATKGPKKGKAVAASKELETRCRALSSLLVAFQGCRKGSPLPKAAELFVSVLVNLCRVVTIVGAGVEDPEGKLGTTLESREGLALTVIEETRALVSGSIEALEQPPNGDVVAQISRLLPDYMVPTLAVFRMAGGILELFGWGRRKWKTKSCAAAFAALASSLSDFVGHCDKLQSR
jgi:N-acetyltransferase B complex (NatB) non catalytic subunit